jgi:hypothetical protein
MQKKSVSHPHVAKILNENPAFRTYPIRPDQEIPRQQLPVLVEPTGQSKVWAFLKESIGKDLSKITMPVIFNEPLTMLQKCAENLEYHDLLRKANKCEDQYLRVGYVIASSYMLSANVVNRIHKVFNPMLGETFDYFEGDLHMVIEQVSHHPPISAIYAESDDFIFEGYLIRSHVLEDQIDSDQF